MTAKEEFKKYSIQIGSEDLIKSKVFPLITDDTESSELADIDKANKKLQEILKETRVRIGTLLKTDNVSFLIGAGASISAGGVSLATIPKPLEIALLAEAKAEVNGEITPPWINLLYETASALSGQQFDYESRESTLGSQNSENIQAIQLNLEDYLSHLHMWLASMGESANSITITWSAEKKLLLEKATLQALIQKVTLKLSALLELPTKGNEDKLGIHRKFIKKVLTRPLNLRRANLFTLNYDTLIEQGADAEGAVLVDGFVGTLRRVFRPESYDLDFYFPAQTTEGRVHRFDRALHLYKLHGSITWHRTTQGWENPYGLYATYHNPICQDDDVLIYPSPLKYGQALGLPYSELFRRFGNAIAQPQSVLFTIGYGFGDDHVNALIRQALAIPSFTLVLIDPEPTNAFVKQLQKLKDERIWIITGWDIGTFEHFVHKLMPDLREEEIDAKVMKTFRALASSDKPSSATEDELDGE